MSTKKIAIVVPSLKPGGLERAASLLANYGVLIHELTLITLDSKPPFYSLNVKVNLIQAPKRITVQGKKKRFFANGLWLRKTVKELEPDVVCSFGEKYNPYVLLFLAGLKIPVYVANRTSPLSSIKGRYGKINPIAYKFASGVILQTEQSVDILNNNYSLKKTAVIGNPVNLNYPEAKREKVVLNVGSIGGNKNQDWLIRYFSKLDTGNWKLHFAGEGPLKEKCVTLSKKLKVNEMVSFLGVVKDLKPHYTSASVFAFTSTVEGFPNALAEAMAAGCACIAYDCIAGPSDIIDDGINGFLIPLGDEEQYIEKLKLLMDNTDLRVQFGIEAKKKMKQFEAGVIADRFYKFITEDI